jgi:hypothetical protein
MRPLYTLAAQTRQAIWAVYADALCAWAHGKPINAAEVHSHVEDILDDAFAANRSDVINDIRPGE